MSENIKPFKPGYINPQKDGIDHYQDKIANFRNNVSPFLNKPRGGAVQNWVRPPLLAVWPVFNVQVEVSPLAVNNVNVQFTPQQAAAMIAQATPANIASVQAVVSPLSVTSIVVDAEPVAVGAVNAGATPREATSISIEATPANPDSIGVNAEPVAVTNLDAKLDPHEVTSIDVEATPAIPTSVQIDLYDFDDPILGLWRYSAILRTDYVVVLDPQGFADAALPLNYPAGSEFEILKVQGYEKSTFLGPEDLIKTDDGLIGGKEGYQLFDLDDQNIVWAYVDFAQIPTAQNYSIYRGQARPPFSVSSVTVDSSPLSATITVDADPATPASVDSGWIPDVPASVVTDSSPRTPSISVEATPAKPSSITLGGEPARPASITVVELGTGLTAPDKPTSISVESLTPAAPSSVSAGNLSVAPAKPTSIDTEVLTIPLAPIAVGANSEPIAVVVFDVNSEPSNPTQIDAGVVPVTPASIDVVSGPEKPVSVDSDIKPIPVFIVNARKLVGTEVTSVEVDATPRDPASLDAVIIPDKVSSVDAVSTPSPVSSVGAVSFVEKPVLVGAQTHPVSPNLVLAWELLRPNQPLTVTVVNLSINPNQQAPTTPIVVTVVDLDKVAPDEPASISVNSEPVKPTSITAVDPSQVAPDTPAQVTVDIIPVAVTSVTVGILPEAPSSVVASSVMSPTSVTVEANPAVPASVNSDSSPLVPTSIIVEEISAKKVTSVTVNAEPRAPSCLMVGTGVQSSFDPSSLSIKPMAWYDADDSTTITTSSGEVTEWRDKSGYSHHLTPPSGQAPVLDSINDRTVVDFTVAAGDILEGRIPLGDKNFTIHMVIAGLDSSSVPLIYSDSKFHTLTYSNPNRITESMKYTDGDFHVVHDGVEKDRSYGISRHETLQNWHSGENLANPLSYYENLDYFENWLTKIDSDTPLQTNYRIDRFRDSRATHLPSPIHQITIEFDRWNKTIKFKKDGQTFIDQEVDPREINKVRDLIVGYKSKIAELIIMPVVDSTTTDIIESYFHEKWSAPLYTAHSYHCSPVAPGTTGSPEGTGAYDGCACVESEKGFQRYSVVPVSHLFFATQENAYTNTHYLGQGPGATKSYPMIDPRVVTWDNLWGDWCMPVFVHSECDGTLTPHNAGHIYALPVWRDQSIVVGDCDCDGDGYWDDSSKLYTLGIGYAMVDMITYDHRTYLGGADGVTTLTFDTGDEYDLGDVLGCWNDQAGYDSWTNIFVTLTKSDPCCDELGSGNVVGVTDAVPAFQVHWPKPWSRREISTQSTEVPSSVACLDVEEIPTAFVPSTSTFSPGSAVWFDPDDASTNLHFPGQVYPHYINDSFPNTSRQWQHLPSAPTTGINGMTTSHYGYNEESRLNVDINFDPTWNSSWQPRHVFIVARPSGSYLNTNHKMPLISAADNYSQYNNGDFELEYNFSSSGAITLDFKLYGDNSQTPKTVSTSIDSNTHLIHIYVENATMALQVDGGTPITTTPPGNLSYGVISGPIIANTIKYANTFFAGEIGDIFICESISASRENDLNDYFMNKWSIGNFNPSKLSNLLSWFDASDTTSIVNSGASVVRWNDRSSNGYTAIAYDDSGSNGTAETGQSTQNSLNVIDCDGDDYFEVTNFANPSSGDLQAFIVCKVSSVTNTADSILSMNAFSDDWQLNAGRQGSWQGQLTVSGQTSGNGTTGSGGSNINPLEYHIYHASFRFGVSEYELLMDGARLGSTSLKSYTSQINSTVDLRIFANRSGGLFPGGSVAEVVIYEDATQLNRQKVEGYLAHKWGLEGYLDNSHPYKNQPPA